MNIYIGIWGGENGLLTTLENNEIENKKWRISTEKKTKQWIDSKVFCEIIDEKMERF
jgi:hypothetical protein